MEILKAHPPSPAHQVATRPTQITMRSELARKSIHLTSILIPILYIFMSRETGLWILVPMTLFTIVVEVLRMRFPAVDAFIQRIFGSMMREHEKSGKPKLSGATYVLLSATLCVLIFPKVVTIAAFAVLIVSDTMAALIGRRFGRHKFLEKSVEGSTAFAVSAVLVVLAVAAIYSAPWTFIAVGVVAACASAVAEAMSYGVNIDDNLTIPLSFGIVMWALLALIGGPEITRILSVV